jgi:hypothetical protein
MKDMADKIKDSKELLLQELILQQIQTQAQAVEVIIMVEVIQHDE